MILAAEGSEAARTAPLWISGYAYGSLGVVVLLPARTPTYPDSSLEELLRHEVAHVLIARAAANRPVPRWFNEGLAMVAADLWGLDDRSRLSWSLLTKDQATLAEVEHQFGGGRGSVGRAYAISGALVRYILQRHGAPAAADILSRVALGQPFDTAFRRTTGEDLDRFTQSFWRRHSVWYRWVPILTSSFTLWVGITLLFLLAAIRRRRRDAALRELWDEQERLVESEPDVTIN